LILVVDPVGFEDAPVYNLDFARPENNPNGFQVYVPQPFRSSNEQLSAIVLIKLLYDINDVEDQALKLVLSACGTMVFIEEFTIPTNMNTNYAVSFVGLANTPDLHKSLTEEHQILLFDLDNDLNRTVKRYILNLGQEFKG
jgi:hypothetical protein